MLLGALAASVFLLLKWRRLAGVTLGLVGGYALFATLVGPYFLAELETRVKRNDHATQPAGIVLLGGFIETNLSAAKGRMQINDSAERLTTFVQLARRFPNARLVMTGGNARLFGSKTTESKWVERYINTAMPELAGRMMYDRKSRNTYENARFTARLIDPGRQWLLVTSGYHLPRALATFRRAGFTNLLPVPCDYRGDASATYVNHRLDMWRVWLKEMIGIAWYRLSGRA